MKYYNFTLFPGVEILLKRTVFAEFRANRPETAFPQNFHTRKLGGILVFYAMVVICVGLR